MSKDGTAYWRAEEKAVWRVWVVKNIIWKETVWTGPRLFRYSEQSETESRNSESDADLFVDIEMGHLFFIFETWLQL